MLKILFVFIISLFLFSCSWNTETKVAENTWSVEVESISDTWEVSETGWVDTKQLEEDLSKDLDEVLNLVPTE